MQHCTEVDCKSEAVFGYAWPWGDPGACCALHQIVVNQRAAQLDRQVTFAIIQPMGPPPITRDERSRLIADKLSAEAELVEVKARAGEMYGQNGDLAAEVRRLRARDVEASAQLKDAKGDLDRVLEERDNALADLHEAQTEIKRLQAILPKSPEPPL